MTDAAASLGDRDAREILGVLSDTHGRAATAGAAARRLLDEGATRLLHLGDVADGTAGGAAVLRAMADARTASGRSVPIHLVFGNCDGDPDGLRRLAGDLGLQVDDPLGRLETAGRTVAYTHGHLPGVVRDALRTRPAYLLHGHSHRIRDEVEGGTRILNPGALFRAVRYTAMRLDPALDEARWIELPREVACDHRG